MSASTDSVTSRRVEHASESDAVLNRRRVLPTGTANQSSTLAARDNLVATEVRANFVRAKVIAISGGTGVTVQILG